LGIQLVRIPWKEAGDFKSKFPSSDFMRKYDLSGDLTNKAASQVHTLLNRVIETNRLDAITVECFSLVKDHDVTACLTLSDLNDHDFPAGCEGDLVSIAGMMLLWEITGQVSWMANLAAVKENFVLFAHCMAPTNLLRDYSVKTHFETDKGTAIQGDFGDDRITIFRLDNRLTKAYLSSGTITDRPRLPDACRTQIEVKLSAESLQLLKSHPLGNHHLILPGEYIELLRLMVKLLNLNLV
jgi:L-fucose isomerase-like protein